MNATQAYLHAYPKSSLKAAESNASRLMDNDRVNAYLDEFRKKNKDEAATGREFVLEKLQLMAEVGLQVNEKKDGDGNVISKKFNDSYTGSKGIELLGRHHKMFTDKVEHSGQVKLTGVLKIDMNPVNLKDWVAGVGGTEKTEK